MINQLPKNWQKKKLGDITSLITKGTTPTTIGRRFTRDGINFIKVESITEDGNFLKDKIDHIDEETNHMLRRSVIHENDVLYSIAGAIGRVVLVTKKELPANTNQALAIIRPKNIVNPRFLFYYLNTQFQKRLANSYVAQSVQSNINLQQVGSFEIPLPSREEQNYIVKNLSAFDDKIEVNNKIAKALEKVAQLIFKEWFVKFRFPGWEKAMFVDSELGKIPKGWEIKKIKDVANINKGLSYSSSEISEKSEGLPMINLANFQRGGGFNPNGIKFYTGRYSSTNLVKSGDIVIAMTDLTSNREVIGHPARVPIYAHWNKILISLDACAIQSDKEYVDFLYYLMLRKDFAYRMASSAGGTNVAHLSKSVIENYEFVFPGRSLLKKFQNLVKPIFKCLNILDVENQKLAQMRDLLLPKLMKGEIRV